MTDLESFFRVVEVSDGRFFAGPIFERKLGGELPDYGRHLVAFHRVEAFRFTPLGYLNILPHETVALIGGGSTDGRGFAGMPEAQAAAIRASGGVLFHLLRYAFTAMAPDFEAFFGYCGDRRAEEVDLAAGFRHTEYPRLLAHFHRPLDAERRRDLTAAVHALGPF